MRLFALALVLVACGPDAPRGAPESPPPGADDVGLDVETATAPEEDRPADQVRPGVRLDRILAPGPDADALLARLRPPRTLRADPVANRHVEGQTDTVRTYVYDGLEIEVYDVSGGPAFVQRLEVSDGGYGTAEGVAVGERRSDLEAVLGAPTHREPDAVWYEVGEDPTPTPVEVVYEPDADGVERASQITWRPYVD